MLKVEDWAEIRGLHQYDYVYDPRRTILRGHRSSEVGPDDDALAKAFIDMAKRLAGQPYGSRETMGS